MLFNMGGTIGSALDADLGDLIPLQLSRTIIPAITALLVPSLTETMGDLVPPQLSTNLRDVLIYTLTQRIGSSVTTRLEGTVTEKVANNVSSIPFG